MNKGNKKMNEQNTTTKNTRTSELSRAEHLQWCKDRALQYVDAGDIENAYASLASDLGKHPETEGHAAIGFGIMMLMSGQLSTADQMRRFINGFN